jgi:hypothetical protein
MHKPLGSNWQPKISLLSKPQGLQLRFEGQNSLDFDDTSSIWTSAAKTVKEN